MIDHEDTLHRLSEPPPTTRGGYDREFIERVWNFARPIEGNDDQLWRKDEFGAWINRLEYGNRNSQFGWEIIDNSMSRRGQGLATLRPCQWQNYLDFEISSDRPQITARGLNNTRRLL